jgi:hypothetical protein
MNSFIPTFSVVLHHILHHLGLTFNEHMLPFIRHPHVLSKVLLRQKCGGDGNGSLAAASATSLALASVSILCCLDSSLTTITIISP